MKIWDTENERFSQREMNKGNHQIQVERRSQGEGLPLCTEMNKSKLEQVGKLKESSMLENEIDEVMSELIEELYK